MAYTTINDPSAHFHTQLYVGNKNSANAITNDANAGDFQPDWLWIKSRDTSGGSGVNFVVDSTRGNTKDLHVSNDEAEHTNSNMLASFDSDGFSIGTSASDNINKASDNYVAWQWKANGGTTSSNDDGDYTSTVQANTTAGFSIVKYGDASSFTASTPATVGHGLGAVPKMIIIKNLDSARDWGVHHASNGAGKIIYLNLTNAVANSTGFDNGTLPTSSVFTVNSLNVANGNNLEYIAYCFAEKQGYSKFGSYTGNGNADGAFVYTGFKPAWVMVKRTNTTGAWEIYDSARNGNDSNPINDRLRANDNAAENTDDTSDYVSDFLSNGWKIRTNSGNWNTSGHTYIYMAFAEHPFVSSKGVPTTAR
jgi:hypothetical protein